MNIFDFMGADPATTEDGKERIDLDELLANLESRTIPVYMGHGNVDDVPDTECRQAAKVIRKLLDFVPETARTVVKVTT